jgi:fatty acid synthase subunit alpha, fungi type
MRPFWALVCTAEALNQSGITDPCELYKHMHPSDAGTSLGNGTESLAKMFKDRCEEKEVHNDTLQET